MNKIKLYLNSPADHFEALVAVPVYRCHFISSALTIICQVQQTATGTGGESCQSVLQPRPPVLTLSLRGQHSHVWRVLSTPGPHEHLHSCRVPPSVGCRLRQPSLSSRTQLSRPPAQHSTCGPSRAWLSIGTLQPNGRRCLAKSREPKAYWKRERPGSE